MARLICPLTGATVNAPNEAAAAKLMSLGYKPAEEPKPKPRRRAAKPKPESKGE